MITNATLDELKKALDLTNNQFDGNIKFKNIKQKSKNRIQFTLTVHDSRNAGGRRGFSGRRVCAACWHVHGEFFDNLFSVNEDSFVRSMGKTIDKYDGNWEDRNIGSMMIPFMYSEACECNGNW